MSSPTKDLLLRVAAITPIAGGIDAFDLRDPAGGELPAFTAGAHIGIRLAEGVTRKYSLCNDPAERGRYEIAVKRESHAPRLVEQVRVGDVLHGVEPHNSFELVDAPEYVFIAGGIGITALLSMIRHLHAGGRSSFHLYYLSRSVETTAFRDELMAAPYAGQVTLHHDAGDPDNGLDLWPILERVTKAHVYCCGPRPLLEAVRDMTGHWPPARVHFESYVDAAAARKPEDRAFTVRFAQSGDSFDVAPGISILDAAREHGHDVPSSCESGTCGTCRTRYLEGEPDHRDLVLSEDEKGEFVMVCVSRSRTPLLVLDR
jgi:phthalate 4,5-dioxygenase reductase subunit